MNLQAVEMKAFVPARDLAVSKAFYEALGFLVPWFDDDLAYVRHDETAFFLQRFYLPEHAGNFMMHLLVEDADAWHVHVLASGVVERFGVRLGAPADRPWRIRDFTLTDPTGVLWRIGHNLPLPMPPPPRLNYLAPVLHVADLRSAVACYRDRLGFDVEFVHAGFYASVMRDGCRIHLHAAAPTAAEAKPSATRTPVGEASIDVCIGTADAGALAACFTSTGATISLPLRSMPYGDEFQVRDPDGHVLAFVGHAADERQPVVQQSDIPHEPPLAFEHRSLPGCVFRDVNLRAARFDDVSLVAASFANVSFAGATFRDVDFSGAAIADANVDGMTIDGVAIADLLRARNP